MWSVHSCHCASTFSKVPLLSKRVWSCSARRASHWTQIHRVVQDAIVQVLVLNNVHLEQILLIQSQRVHVSVECAHTEQAVSNYSRNVFGTKMTISLNLSARVSGMFSEQFQIRKCAKLCRIVREQRAVASFRNVLAQLILLGNLPIRIQSALRVLRPQQFRLRVDPQRLLFAAERSKASQYVRVENVSRKNCSEPMMAPSRPPIRWRRRRTRAVR